MVSYTTLTLLFISSSLATFCKETRLKVRKVKKTYPCCTSISCDPPICSR